VVSFEVVNFEGDYAEVRSASLISLVLICMIMIMVIIIVMLYQGTDTGSIDSQLE